MAQITSDELQDKIETVSANISMVIAKLRGLLEIAANFNTNRTHDRIDEILTELCELRELRKHAERTEQVELEHSYMILVKEYKTLKGSLNILRLIERLKRIILMMQKSMSDLQITASGAAVESE